MNPLPLVLLAGFLGPATDARNESLAARVKLVGNSAFATEKLRKTLSEIECDSHHAIEAVTAGVTHGGAVAECKSLDDLAATLETFYLSNGYILAKAHASSDGPPVVTVEEGSLFRVGAVEIAETHPGKDELGDPDRLKAALALPAGEPFLRKNIQAAIERVRSRYRAAGYAQANVTPSVGIEFDERKVDLKVEVERGPIHK